MTPSRMLSRLVFVLLLAVLIAWAVPALGWWSPAVSSAETVPALVHPRSGSCATPSGYEQWRSAVATSARNNGLDEALWTAQVWTESNFVATARSRAGAYGLAQLMPATATMLGVDIGSPTENLDGGARFMADLLRRYDGREDLALAAYNAGPGRVGRSSADGRVPAITETRNYVARITARRQCFTGTQTVQSHSGLGASTAAFWSGAAAVAAERYDIIDKPVSAVASFFEWAVGSPEPSAPVFGTGVIARESTRGPVVGTDMTVLVGPDIRVHRDIAAQTQALLDAAAADGIVLEGWGWRSMTRQAQLRRINGCHPPPCRVPTARPGSSMHERGKAIDFRYGGSIISTRRSVAYQWLAANAARYGFYNLPSEPWHWSTNGK